MNDPLSDPLSSAPPLQQLNSITTPTTTSIPATSTNKIINNNSRFSFNDYTPFSNNVKDEFIQQEEEDSLNDNNNQHQQTLSEPITETEESNHRQQQGEEEEFIYPNSTSQAISIRPGSLNRSRSPSTSVLRGSPSSPFTASSVTPTNTFNDFSTTPSATNSFALRFDSPPVSVSVPISISIYNQSGELEKDALISLLIKECIEGTVYHLKSLLEGDGNDNYPSIFELVNTPSSSGQTLLHLASTHGKLEIVKYLIKEGGALVDFEDTEGDTPLHRASIKGHLNVCEVLIENGANVDAVDNDGWTSLMNAASKGYLDVVRFLIETAGASIDKQSKHGYTALHNASSKGHLAVVQFLITKHKASPFLRNAYQETAFDLAASVFEILICSLLANFERSLYTSSVSSSDVESESEDIPAYNPLLSHSTFPVILHENQRLARPSLKRISSLTNLATGQNPRWSSKALSINDKRAAFTIPTQIGFNNSNENFIENRPMFRSEVSLPIVGNEGELVLPPLVEKNKGKGKGSSNNTRPIRSRSVSASSVKLSTESEIQKPKGTRRISASSSLSAVLGSTSTNSTALAGSITPSNSASTSSSSSSSIENGEAAFFWLSDWVLDLTDLTSSPIDGWSYAHDFDAPIEDWTSEIPSELQATLDSNGGLGGQKWVRRRRWTRVMRRRLDLPSFGFNGVSEDGQEVELNGEDELINVLPTPTPPPSSDADYTIKAQYLAGEHHLNHSSSRSRSNSVRSSKSPSRVMSGNNESNTQLNRSELRKSASRLERAVEELNSGILIDEDADRRNKALIQSELYLHQLSLIQEELGSSSNNNQDDSEDSDDEFIYNGKDVEEVAENGNNVRPASVRSRSSYLSYQQQSPSYSIQPLPDLTPQLSNAPEFRVPTHETSIKIQQTIKNSIPTPSTAIWQIDSTAQSCNDCSKIFNFFVRKHHCRNCGLIYCHACSSNVDKLLPQQVVKEPNSIPLDPWASLYRTCDSCHLNLSETLSVASVAAFFPSSPIINNNNNNNLAGTSSPLISGSESGQSDASELAQCPVCDFNLTTLGSKEEQESHVQSCLESGGGNIARNGSYLVFKLPSGPLVGQECSICYVEFEVNDKLARLPCLDIFHLGCIRAWLDRSKSCPYHESRSSY